MKTKVCLVTGASGELGQAMVRAFLAKGYTVVAADLRADASLTGVAFVTMDVTDAAQTAGVIGDVVARMGHIDVLVNAAGIVGAVEAVDDLDPEGFRGVLAVNVLGCFHTMRGVLPGMRRRGAGVVLNIGSVSSAVGGRGLAAYAASKHAVLGLTRSAAQDLAGTGVRVLCLGPGPLEGRMMDGIDQGRPGAAAEGVRAATLSRVPSRRYGRMEEVAAFAVFLASEEAAFINGAFLPIDGGRLAS